MTIKAGLYIHIPFCIRKCRYCDFYSISDMAAVTPFINALTDEIRMIKRGGEFGGMAFDSVYIGGGTPTVLDDRSIGSIMDQVSDTFAIAEKAEITIEANPAAITEKQLRNIRRAGINRINIGVQSFNDENLAFLGRLHSAADSRKALKMAEKIGFDQIGIDIMYGLPGQDLENLQKDLEQAAGSGVSHISCYMLTFEPETPMDKARIAGEFVPLDESDVGEFFLTTSRMLASSGFDHYEISNFAKSTRLRSVHNTGYWRNRPYLGLGPSAHSCLPPRRTENVRSVHRYIRCIQTGRSPVVMTETLNRDQQMMEVIYLGLRQSAGIDYEVFRRRFEVDFLPGFSGVVEQFATMGLMIADDTGCRLTLEGMLVQESVAQAFIDLI